jgi:hypothetical protein
MGDELEQRIHARRIVSGRIRSFSAVAREALIKGLDALDQEGSRAAAISTHPAFSTASGAPKGA